MQPDECKLGGPEIYRHYPKTWQFIRNLLDGWIASGFNEAAELGWPLEIAGSEFISINRWRFAKNASCVLNDLYAAADPYVTTACLDDCPEAAQMPGGTAALPSYSPCWERCRYDAITNHMPQHETRALLEAARTNGSCRAVRYKVLDGPMEYLMGGNGFFDFAPSKIASYSDLKPFLDSGRAWGSQRLLSNLKAWLTAISNSTMYQVPLSASDGPRARLTEMLGASLALSGAPVSAPLSLSPVSAPSDPLGARSVAQGWHDWHTDGPSHYGRYHKMFVMVDKEDAPRSQAHTNVKLIPAETLYAHAKCFGKFSEEPEGILQHHYRDVWPLSNMSRDERHARERLVQAWGMNVLWHGFERLGCTVPLNPGDMLFFREDTWHRTQDMDHDRIGFIMDILTLPRYDLPKGYPLLRKGSDRVRQPLVLERLQRQPPHVLASALAALPPRSSAAPPKYCHAPEELAQLPWRGFVVLRQVLSTESCRAALAAHRTSYSSESKVEAGGRVYSHQLSEEQLRAAAPSLLDQLQRALDMLHERGVLPPTRAPFATDGTAALRVTGGQYIAIDPARARAHGCPQCTERTCQQAECESLVDWHVDGDGYRRSRIHKLFVLLHKEAGEAARGHANLVLAPSTGLDALADAVQTAQQQPQEQQQQQSLSARSSPSSEEALLEAIGCPIALEAGDAIFFAEDVYHRTQDLLAERVAMLLNVQ